MSILSMTVTAAAPHPNADALRIYTLQCPLVEGLIVIANLETSYAVGDTVAVARIGAVLPDGTVIRKTRLRGQDSFGMLLGPTSEPSGTDLRARFGAPQPDVASAPRVAFAKWTSVELLHHIRAGLAVQRAADDTFALPRVVYRAKIKLDGTNAALHATPDGFVAQSRTRLLTPDDDNYGFAAWAQQNAAWAESLGASLGRAVVFGEWCGIGIQRRTALSKIERKVFAVFAVQVGDPGSEAVRILVDPERIQAALPAHPDVFVLPWHGDPVELDFADEAQLRGAAAQINAMVDAVETEDPWVASTFGVRGVGEGVVMYPVQGAGIEADADGLADRDRYTAWLFKAKGEKHRTTRDKKAAQLDPEVVHGVEQFVAHTVTPARLQQGLDEASGGKADLRAIGAFLRWVSQDVHKETAVELHAAGLAWKQVAPAVAAAAKAWFLDQAR